MQKIKELVPESFIAFVETPVGMAVVGGALLVFALASCRIFAKAGFRAAAGLLMLVPGVNLVAYLYLAFAPWPVRAEARQLRKVQKSVHRFDAKHGKSAA